MRKNSNRQKSGLICSNETHKFHLRKKRKERKMKKTLRTPSNHGAARMTAVSELRRPTTFGCCFSFSLAGHFSPRVSLWNCSDLQDAGESAVNSYPVRCQLAQRMNSESCPAILPEAEGAGRDRSPLAPGPGFIPGSTGGFIRGTNTHVRFICRRAGKKRKQESAPSFRFWS